MLIWDIILLIHFRPKCGKFCRPASTDTEAEINGTFFFFFFFSLNHFTSHLSLHTYHPSITARFHPALSSPHSLILPPPPSLLQPLALFILFSLSSSSSLPCNTCVSGVCARHTKGPHEAALHSEVLSNEI